MKRIYHPYWRWEDYKNGFYDNVSGEEKKRKVKKAVQMFNDSNLTKKNMLKVINEWKYSCEHNLTNESLNKIAYIGQGACCIYGKIPSTATMEAWSLLKPSVQDRANEIAKEVIKIWETRNKEVQLCLSLD